jgi:hypothetical protein
VLKQKLQAHRLKRNSYASSDSDVYFINGLLDCDGKVRFSSHGIGGALGAATDQFRGEGEKL